MAEADTTTGTQENTTAVVDDASRPFVGKWHTLVSTTNWEKGRIISEWRAAKQEAGEEVNEYSDEAWANLVGEVTSQHVGRLRRVHDKYGDRYTDYEGLYWSHFHAAIDWDDAEIWLEGALQKSWSISQMRKARDKAHGKSDEDAGVSSSTISKAELEPTSGGELAAVMDPEDEDGHEDHDGEVATAERTTDSESAGPSEEMPAAERSTSMPKSRPFESLGDLPDDLADAFEAMKLAILSHKMTEWEDVSCDDVLASLDALKALAVAPSE
ncbi:hypothetical protein [Aeoliella mucimassa]|uniref:Uncharacterized protein n=1 Tax=Aeoliella mucimassa TaxID=2527972 RepID=A0A518AHV1_9BACT|nr:hypothetical protein [Aeoliella mucimassa]QDU54300.1 hypothetical protein Pan181_04810 [Aeoliella mucimassa]